MDNYKLSFNAATSTGLREKNQDVFLADGILSSPEKTEDRQFKSEGLSGEMLHVFAVCDGVGMFRDSGPAANAALFAIKEEQEKFNEALSASDMSTDSILEWAEEALISAQDALLDYCRKNNTRGASTLSLLAIVNDIYIMINTGDSPVFTANKENLTELSTRHNEATRKMLTGVVPSEGDKRILLHYLGEANLIFEEKYGTLHGDEVFLLCSDGVTNAFDEEELHKCLTEDKDASFLASRAAGYPDADNCTAITVKIRKAADD